MVANVFIISTGHWKSVMRYTKHSLKQCNSPYSSCMATKFKVLPNLPKRLEYKGFNPNYSGTFPTAIPSIISKDENGTRR